MGTIIHLATERAKREQHEVGTGTCRACGHSTILCVPVGRGVNVACDVCHQVAMVFEPYSALGGRCS